MTRTRVLSLEQAEALCRAAALGVGASAAAADSIARAAVAAEADGQPAVGLAHFLDYLDGFREGRIACDAEPVLTRPAPGLIQCDAGGGVAQLGFDLAMDGLASAARRLGVAIFAQRNAYTCGSLGYFVLRLAEQGLMAMAATNGPALLAVPDSHQPVYSTNPLAFAAPGRDGPALVIDQASSATAFVNIRQAARRGEAIPGDWAIDEEGQPTTDPARALKGALLAFGGARGANIALVVEILAAGLTGANWSLDAPSFTEGTRTPGSGLFVLAMDVSILQPDFRGRLHHHLDRLSKTHGVHVPGKVKQRSRQRAAQAGLAIPAWLIGKLQAAASGKADSRASTGMPPTPFVRGS